MQISDYIKLFVFVFLCVFGEIGHLHSAATATTTTATTGPRCRTYSLTTYNSATANCLTPVVRFHHLVLYPFDLSKALQPVTGIGPIVFLAQATQYLRRQLRVKQKLHSSEAALKSLRQGHSGNINIRYTAALPIFDNSWEFTQVIFMQVSILIDLSSPSPHKLFSQLKL